MKAGARRQRPVEPRALYSESVPAPESGSFHHLTVMKHELVSALAPRPGGIYVDATLGGGGHSELLLSQCAPDGRVIGLDRDPQALEAAGARLKPFGERLVRVHGRFSELEQHLDALGIGQVDGVMADLGVSSPQLDQAERGFSFQKDGPLDMRMDPSSGPSAADLLATLEADALARIFWEHGEERFSGKIARAIVADRKERPFTRTLELAQLIARLVPGGREARIHPATRVFQALRIAVNGEDRELAEGLQAALSRLRPGGRLAILSFHSGEDRRVKQQFRDWASTCVCPPGLPICICGNVALGRILTPRPLEANEEEVLNNPRARSVRLRILEKCAGSGP